jgi:hypothetical protein
LYSGASAFDLAMKAACASASSGDGVSVRVATGWPTSAKNSSCPEGAHRHITQRNELVLPLHGGPPVTAPETLAVRDQVHRALKRIIERGHTDGTISQDVTPRDVVAFGAMLAQPRRPDPEWDATCRRLLATYLNGLRTR